MKKMVELLGEERGPQDIEEVCFEKKKKLANSSSH